MLAGLKEDIEERKDAQEQSIFNLETSRVNLLVHAKLVNLFMTFCLPLDGLSHPYKHSCMS